MLTRSFAAPAMQPHDLVPKKIVRTFLRLSHTRSFLQGVLRVCGIADHCLHRIVDLSQFAIMMPVGVLCSLTGGSCESFPGESCGHFGKPASTMLRLPNGACPPGISW